MQWWTGFNFAWVYDFHCSHQFNVKVNISICTMFPNYDSLVFWGNIFIKYLLSKYFDLTWNLWHIYVRLKILQRFRPIFILFLYWIFLTFRIFLIFPFGMEDGMIRRRPQQHESDFRNWKFSKTQILWFKFFTFAWIFK